MDRLVDLGTPEATYPIDVFTLSPTFNQRVLEQDWSFLHPQELPALGDGMVKLVNTVMTDNIDTMFFMDKSARPIGIMLPILMQTLGIVHKLDLRFLNLKYFRERSLGNLGDFFVTPTEQGLFRQTFGDLNGRRICLTDAYMDQGKELKRARRIVTCTFPRVKSVVTAHVLDDFPSWEGQKERLGVADPVTALNPVDWHIASERTRPNVFLSNETPTDQFIQFNGELSQFAEVLGQNTEIRTVPPAEKASYVKQVVFVF